MAKARIFQRPKNAMQSGRARTDRWMLEFEPAEAKRADPLTGWAGSGDTREQVRLGFATAEAAIAYAEKVGPGVRASCPRRRGRSSCRPTRIISYAVREVAERYGAGQVGDGRASRRAIPAPATSAA